MIVGKFLIIDVCIIFRFYKDYRILNRLLHPNFIKNFRGSFSSYGGGNNKCCCSDNLFPILAALAAAVFYLQMLITMMMRRRRRRDIEEREADEMVKLVTKAMNENVYHN